MTTLNDYLTAGRKALQQWRPQFDAVLKSTVDSHAAAPSFSKPAEKRPDENWPPALDNLLKQEHGLPPYSALLGVGEDRLPYHLDLTNPASGAVLVCSDTQAENTGLMRSILASATALNTPEQVSISVIAKDIDSFFEFSEAAHCHEVLPAEDETVSEFLQELAESVEQRKAGKKPEPAVLLFIDDLAECLDFIGEQAYARLYWLIRHGPRHRVWTFASLPVDRTYQVGERFLSAFRTRLVGPIKDNHMAAEMSQDPRLRTGSLKPGQFYLPYGSEWMRFWTCPVDHAVETDK